MVAQNSLDVAREARRIYEESLRTSLEQSHLHMFVAIEPVSGDFFLGQTLSEAIGSSRKKHPNRLAHALRIGHSTTVHFGVHVQ